MQCIYFDDDANICKLQSVVSLWPYKPSQDEINSFCKSNRFQKCKRLEAFQQHLDVLSGKQGIWFVHPDLLPRPLLLTRTRQLLRALSPRKDFQSEIMFFIDQLILDQIQPTFRQNFLTELSLERFKFGSKGLAVKVDVDWKYEVHNTSDSPIEYKIPMKVTTHSFVNEGLPIEDHVVIREITTSVGDSNDWTDLFKKYKLDSVVVTPRSQTKVQLILTERASQIIPPNDFIRVCLRFAYVSQLRDDHTQRMLALTRNFRLKLNYSKEDFLIDVDDFCLPKRSYLVRGQEYEWKGWLFPHHGVIVDWMPIWLMPDLMKIMKV